MPHFNLEFFRATKINNREWPATEIKNIFFTNLEILFNQKINIVTIKTARG